MTEYEMLGLEEWDSKCPLSQTFLPSESESPVIPSLTPQSSPPSTPSPPASPLAPEQPEEVGKEVQVASGSPQLRLFKKKAPEVFCLITVGCSAASNGPFRVQIFSLIH